MDPKMRLTTFESLNCEHSDTSSLFSVIPHNTDIIDTIALYIAGSKGYVWHREKNLLYDKLLKRIIVLNPQTRAVTCIMTMIEDITTATYDVRLFHGGVCYSQFNIYCGDNFWKNMLM